MIISAEKFFFLLETDPVKKHFFSILSAVPFCLNSETVRVVKAARHEKVELECSMDAGSSVSVSLSGASDKSRPKLDFRWSLNTSRDQVRIRLLNEKKL